MITLTATWGDWEFAERPPGKKTVHPTPGRDRPIIVECSSPFTAGVLKGIFNRLGMDVTI
jgi:hypothetical protein